MEWTWNTGTFRERAALVRSHYSGCCLGNREITMELFALTEDGLDAILHGADWRPEYSSPVAPEGQ